MSIATEIQRIQGAKDSIKSSIENKGVTVPSDAKLDDYPSYIDSIQGGGGVSGAENLVNPQFDEWGQLKGDVVFKDSVTNLGKSYYFYGNENLRSVKGDGVTTFGGYNVFTNCYYMNSIDFPNCEKANFEGETFAHMDLLTSGGGVINFPKVKDLTVGTYSLMNVKATLNIPSDLERLSLANYAFGGYDFNFFERINFNSLKKIKLTQDWWNTNAQIVWPERLEFDSLEEIENDSYEFIPYYTDLKALVFGENLTYIGGYSIGVNDFALYFKSKTPPTLRQGYESVTFNRRDNFKIYVPCESLAAYRGAWSEYADIIEGYDFENDTPNCDGGGGGGGLLTDFIFNYNAKDYDSSTKTIAKTDGQALNIDAVFTKGTPTVRDNYLVVSGSEVNLNPDGSNASLFNWNASSPNMTFVFKGMGALSGNDGVLYSNAWSGRNFYLSLYSTSIQLRDSGNGITISNSVSNSTANIVSVTVEGLTYKVKNHTTNQEWSGSLNGYGQDQTKGGALFYNIMTSNYFNGTFYWMYMAKRVLSDDEIQDVITFNE